LPIHRLGQGKSRSRVFAYKSELDIWLRKRSGLSVAQEKEHPSPKLHVKAGLLGMAALVVVVFLFVFLFSGLSPLRDMRLSRQPEGFSIKGSELIAQDSDGRTLWRYDTKMSNLESESYYRNHFQSKHVSPEGLSAFPLLAIEDIDEDGQKEVLFIPATRDSTSRGDLICLSSRGQLKWSYNPDRAITFGKTRYSGDFLLYGLGLLPRDSYVNKARIVVFGQHVFDFPTYVDILTGQGENVGEYWNSGRILDYVLSDLNQDGREELVLAGTNNEYNRGCLLGLNPDKMRGGSPQSGSYRASDIEAGAETRYVLFPRTPVDKLEFGPRGNIGLVYSLASGRIMAIAQYSDIVFELDRRLQVERVIISDSYKEKLRRLQDEKKLAPQPFDEARLAQELVDSVQYFDGRGWSAWAF